MTPRLDILTVSYFSSELLQKNKEIFENFNAGEIDYKWHVVDNSLKEDSHLAGFEYHPGVGHAVDPLRIGRIKIGSGSVHHGMGMNLGKQFLDPNADMWLIMDPDFYFLVPLQPIIKYIMREDLWFFGAQYVNTRKRLVKNFPCLFAMFINPRHVNANDLDFSVGYINDQDVGMGYYPDAGYKIMYSYKSKPQCKYATFQKTDANTYYVRKTPVAIHLRAKLDKLKKYLHGRAAPTDIGLSSLLSHLRHSFKVAAKTNAKVSLSDIALSVSGPFRDGVECERPEPSAVELSGVHSGDGPEQPSSQDMV